MIELKQCPKCGRRPWLGYACGEYFIVGQVEGCGVCDTFGEMHASREQEAEAWNRRADRGALMQFPIALKGKRKTVKGLIWNYRTNCGAKIDGGED